MRCSLRIRSVTINSRIASTWSWLTQLAKADYDIKILQETKTTDPEADRLAHYM